MSQSLALVLVRLVFSTKERIPFFQSTELRVDTHAYLGGIARNLGCQPIQIGGVADHVHLLTGLSRSISIAGLVKELKIGSSKRLKAVGPAQFSWRTGYGAFSVSQSAKESVISYIANQETHHRKLTFQDELRALLKKHVLHFFAAFLPAGASPICHLSLVSALHPLFLAFENLKQIKK